MAAPDGGVSYYNFDELTDQWGSNDGTNNGATTSSNYPIFNMSGNSGPDSFDFDGTNDYVSIGEEVFSSFGFTRTYSAWVKTTNNIGAMGIVSGYVDGTIFQTFSIQDGKIQIVQQSGGGTYEYQTGSTNIADGNWHHVVGIKNGISITDVTLYVDGNEESISNDRNEYLGNESVSFSTWYIGYIPEDAQESPNYFLGNIDEVKIYNTVLNTTEIENLYNYGTISGSGATNFQITAIDNATTESLTNFSATVDDTNYNTTNGTIVTDLLSNSTILHNITVYKPANGYFNKTYTNYNVSSNLEAKLTPKYYIYNTTIAGYHEYSGTNYSNELHINYTYHCYDNATAYFYFNTLSYQNDTLQCNSTTPKKHTNSLTIQPSAEGEYNTTGYLQNSGYNITIINQTFTFDLQAPTLKAGFNFTPGFDNISSTPYMQCNDTMTPQLYYNYSYNSNLMYAKNTTNATLITNSSELQDGTNTINAVCKDFFFTTDYEEEKSIYIKNMQLIDEKLKQPFNIDNVTSAVLYFDDNSAQYSFTEHDTNQVNFSVYNETRQKTRLELKYEDGTIITRYVDVSILPEQDIRMCANSEGTTHYEQLMVSNSETPVLLKNTYSMCYVAADYTRFSYQDTLALKAYTIEAPYTLKTRENGSTTYLSSLDGSIANTINLDNIEFNRQQYKVSIFSDSITFEDDSNTSKKIYYQNLAEDNEKVQIQITRMDTGEILHDSTEEDNPNDFNIYFDISTYDNINSTTLFKLTMTKYKENGDTETATKHFFISGKSGMLKPIVAVVFAILLVAFGLTISIARLSLGWLGVIFTVVAIATLGLAPGTWYILYFQGITAIIMVYQILIMIKENYQTIS